MKNKCKFQPGNLIEILQADELCIGQEFGHQNECFNPGDLLLVVENDALIDRYGTFYYHFISSKSGNSIYWGRDDLEECCPDYFKKVNI